MRKIRDNEKQRRKSASAIRQFDTYRMAEKAPDKAALKHMRRKPYS